MIRQDKKKGDLSIEVTMNTFDCIVFNQNAQVDTLPASIYNQGLINVCIIHIVYLGNRQNK